MKKIIFLLLPLTLLANETTILDITQFQICSYKSSRGQCYLERPLGLLVNANAIARVPTTETHSSNITYNDNQELALLGFKFDHCSGGTFFLGAGGYGLRWRQNNNFQQTYFPVMNIGLAGYTEFNQWFWQAGFNAQVQLNSGNSSPLQNSTRYSAVVWGRYAYCDPLGIDLGLIAYTGINKTTVVPIIGFDYTLSEHWQIDLIFPVNMALFYNIADGYSISIAGRPFWARCRLEKTEQDSEGIFDYHNYGTELSFNYTSCRLLWAIYGGWAYGGSMKIENSGGGTLAYAHYDGSPYMGANLLWAF